MRKKSCGKVRFRLSGQDWLRCAVRLLTNKFSEGQTDDAIRESRAIDNYLDAASIPFEECKPK